MFTKFVRNIVLILAFVAGMFGLYSPSATYAAGNVITIVKADVVTTQYKNWGVPVVMYINRGNEFAGDYSVVLEGASPSSFEGGVRFNTAQNPEGTTDGLTYRVSFSSEDPLGMQIFVVWVQMVNSAQASKYVHVTLIDNSDSLNRIDLGKLNLLNDPCFEFGCGYEVKPLTGFMLYSDQTVYTARPEDAVWSTTFVTTPLDPEAPVSSMSIAVDGGAPAVWHDVPFISVINIGMSGYGSHMVEITVCDSMPESNCFTQRPIVEVMPKDQFIGFELLPVLSDQEVKFFAFGIEQHIIDTLEVELNGNLITTPAFALEYGYISWAVSGPWIEGQNALCMYDGEWEACVNFDFHSAELIAAASTYSPQDGEQVTLSVITDPLILGWQGEAEYGYSYSAGFTYGECASAPLGIDEAMSLALFSGGTEGLTTTKLTFTGDCDVLVDVVLTPTEWSNRSPISMSKVLHFDFQSTPYTVFLPILEH